MKPFSCSVDMTDLPDCQVMEVRVERTGYNLFFCTAVLGFGEDDLHLGPIVLGLDGAFTTRWPPGTATLLGGHLEALFEALRFFMKQQGVTK